MVAIAALAALVGGLVAVLIPRLPEPASKEMDRIVFTYWFATIICIGIFSLVAARDRLRGLDLPRAARRRHGRAADPRPYGSRDRVDGRARDPRHRDRRRQRRRAFAERRRRPRSAQGQGVRAAVRLAVRLRGRRALERARPARRPRRRVHDGLGGRDPLALDPADGPEAGRRPGYHDGDRDHADANRSVHAHLHRAVRPRPLDHARARARSLAGELRGLARAAGPGGTGRRRGRRRAAAAPGARRDDLRQAGCGGCHAFAKAGTDAQIGPRSTISTAAANEAGCRPRVRPLLYRRPRRGDHARLPARRHAEGLRTEPLARGARRTRRLRERGGGDE